jgi:hypothetical protein
LKDEQTLALLPGELGKARLANNLNQLAKAVVMSLSAGCGSTRLR